MYEHAALQGADECDWIGRFVFSVLIPVLHNAFFFFFYTHARLHEHARTHAQNRTLARFTVVVFIRNVSRYFQQASSMNLLENA